MIRAWFRNVIDNRSMRSLAAVGGGFTVLLAAIYWPTLLELEERWRIDPSWSHGYAVVPAFLVLMWSMARQGGAPWRTTVPLTDVATGTLAIAVGLALHGLANLYFMRPLTLDAVGFVIALLGLLWFLGGRLAARTFSGAVLFLLFMVPLPFAWQQPLAETLQHVVSITSETLLSLAGVPVHREGYLLHLPSQTVEVAEGCSGLRQITLFLAMSVFLGLRSRRCRVWLPLLMLSIPVAVLANTLRITLTGLIVAFIGPEWASGVLHDVEGLLTFALGLAMLWSAAYRLQSLIDRGGSAEFEQSASEAASVCAPNGLRLRTRIAALAVLLACGVAANAAEQHWVVELGHVPPIRLARPLAEFPSELGDWVGVETPVARREFLYGEEHLHRVYRQRETGQTVTLWMVYTDDGRDRAHYPEVCLRTIGHTEERDQRQSVAVPGPGEPVKRYYFRRPSGQAGQWVYHWHYLFRDQFDLLASPHWWQRLQRSLRFHRSGLSVEVFAPKFSEVDREAADEFVRRVAEQLPEFVPETALRRTTRGNYLILGGGRFVKD